jgi:outer membrane protein OmpA-like peptidoglycan-associated protein
MIQQVTQLGLKYNLLTQYTSFIAIDSIIRNKTGVTEQVKQPLPLPEGVSDLAVGNEKEVEKSDSKTQGNNSTPIKTEEKKTESSGDSDGDGIPDSYDKCPDVPGTSDNDGCPAAMNNVTKSWMDAAETVKFKIKKWDISPNGIETIDKLAQIMTEHPKYMLKISGYSDNKEAKTEKKAIKLSKKRAEAVMKYLLSKGIDKKRISYDGYGKTNFIATNSTEAGRKLNRRVEFKMFLP